MMKYWKCVDFNEWGIHVESKTHTNTHTHTSLAMSSIRHWNNPESVMRDQITEWKNEEKIEILDTCLHLHTRPYTQIHTPTHAHTHTYTYIHIHIPTHLHTYTPTLQHTYTSIYTPTHTYAHLHTYTQTHLHLHTYTYNAQTTLRASFESKGSEPYMGCMTIFGVWSIGCVWGVWV